MADADLPRQTITVKLRLRDKHACELRRQARAVNVVWNHANETQQKAARSGRRWLGYHDLASLTAGAGRELDLHSHTVQLVCRHYDRSRRQQRKPWLRFRGRKSLGWVPFNTGHVAFDGIAFVFRGVRYETMHLREMLVPGMTFGAGSFNADARGRWYLNVPVEVECAAEQQPGGIGIDLGLKTLATCSDGRKIAMPSYARRAEAKLGMAQRARKKRLVRTLHARVRNQRKDYLHKASATLAKEHGLIAVGNVSPSRMARTRMAKSVLDAGWSDFRTMLTYKAMRHGGRCVEVDEAMSSQVCSACGSLPPSRPRGIADLGKRSWLCNDCGTFHDRDVNAAQNILLRCGLASPVGGTPTKAGNSGLRAGE